MSHTSGNHPHLRQPLASRGSAKTRAGSNHGEPTPLTLASRCGSVGPLLRPRECTTTPDPSGEYDEARGSRPQDVGVSSSRPHSQRPTKGARRRRTASRLSTSPPKLTKQLRRADKARSEGLPRQTQKQQRRGPWADGQTSHEKTTPAESWPDRSTSSPRGGGKRGGDRFSPQKCGSTTDSAERNVWSDLRPIATRPTHTTWGAPRMRCNEVQCNFQSPFD